MGSDSRIVDWMYDHLDPDAFENEATLTSAVSAKDKDGRVDGWMNSSKVDWIKSVGGSNPPLFEQIDEYNRNEVTGKVSGAGSEKDLDDIDTSGFYSDGARDEALSMIEGRREELAAAATITIEIGDELVDIPPSFNPGRPRDDVRGIYESLGGEFMSDLLDNEGDMEALNGMSVPNGPREFKRALERALSDAKSRVRQE